MSRFERQTILSGFGQEGQGKLSHSKVLVVGAGGLGCPALLYLAAAGVGTIGIADGDEVSLSNLNRQVIYGERDIGRSKAEVAAEQIRNKYSDIQINVIPYFLNKDNALSVIAAYDLVLDGSDNFGTRYLINDACYILKKPLVFGAIYQHEGQVAILNVQDNEEPLTYRDLFPIPPSASEVPNCSETGVLGVLPGIIGTMQATEAIKYLTNFGNPLIHKVLFYNLKDHGTYMLDIGLNPDGRKLMPRTASEFHQMDYAVVCGPGDLKRWEDVQTFMAEHPENAWLLDVREDHELPKLDNLPYIPMPLSHLKDKMHELAALDTIFVFCQSGIRSARAVEDLKAAMPAKNIYTIEGGIKSLLQKN
ncbi:HesA/MoeB/ThiF family protein [Anditalea andensis]|uniref:Molybdopterin-synthase adenylyltransferase n=1 Tax=Anditalea andensis TaxID=1048983 RepID=A0A074L5R9_9BACT|nr:HesA/MoeB/ThiF family protein [Anditalea andensis]KEO75845.1 hypothetical protein EL17_22755 [Anditalea andensis]